MAGIQNLETAKIIQFPVQRRLGSAGFNTVSARDSEERPVVISDAWYHEAALRDERPRKQ